MDSVRMHFDDGADSALVRQAAREVLAGWEAAHVADDALTVITELIHNVIKHTDTGGRLDLTRQADAILIEVFDGSTQPPRRFEPDSHRIGGRGLLIVDAMARDWGTQAIPHGRPGKVVWAEIPLDQSA
ncbi:ATP-binding protein [Micromonospora sp. WMMD1076]|uniref:ATP-binding protein n=1 Tax=Micromonospora sp. WMMD1076 TaxID=3016103 RepID=UPI00249A6BAD|nr:ATP-binding protein [Micromonospora sp. WMMD1076]WFF04622.1 ATP-binding protein [Micromonospora sp. WMMD1076]